MGRPAPVIPFLCSAVLVLSGCSSATYTHSLVVAPDTAPAAEVFFFRKSAFVGMAVGATVTMDDERLIRLQNGRYAEVYVSPGFHVLTVDFGASSETRGAHFAEGRAYYLSVSPLVAISPAEAESPKMKLAPLGDATTMPDRFPAQQAQDARLRDRANWILTDLEAREEGGPGLPGPHDFGAEVESVLSELAAEIEARPDDVETILLYVRLGRAWSVAQPVAYARNAEGQLVREGEDHIPTLLAVLDRASELEPDNAEVYYWKARLHGMTTMASVDGRVQYPMRNRTEAIASAQKAVELAPETLAYREALAQYLINAERNEEAMDVLRGVAGGSHPLYRILAEWQRLPVPSGAIYSRLDTESFLDQVPPAGSYPRVRARFYVVPLEAAEITVFYAQHWPGFELHLIEEEREEGGQAILFYAQHLTERDGVLQPARRKKDLPDSVQDGIAFFVWERRGVPEAERQETPAGHRLVSDPGEVFCQIIIVNFSAYER